MRVNLRINFGKIENLVSESNGYVSSINDMQEALNKLIQVLDSNKGLSADKLKNIPVDINTQLVKLSTGTESMAKVLSDFCITMTEIIKPMNNDMDMYLPTNNVKGKLKKLSNKLLDLETTKNVCELPRLNEFSYNGEKDEYYEIAKSVILRMEEIKEEYNVVTKRLINTYVDEIDVIYKKVEDFENTDDEFENKGELIYEDWLDLKWYETTTSKIIFGVIGVAACIVVICFAGPIVGAATSALGLSASTGAITGTVVSVAKGGLMGVVATSCIDASIAVFAKEDMDNVVGNVLCEGLITGMVSTGFVEVIPVIVKGSFVDDLLSAKVQAISLNKDKIISGTAKVTGDMVGEKIASDYVGKDYNLFISLGKAVGGQAVDDGKDMLLDRLDIIKDSLEASQKFKDGVFMGYRGFVNILDGDAGNISIDDISNNGINNINIQDSGDNDEVKE